MSIDPENRRKLLLLQKADDNKRCADCDAFNPQWALPKFGIFICLECAGIHRGLGVHISFVRSITMDQFKPEEVLRMEKGGNLNCRKYFEEHGLDAALPHRAKYDNPVAEDYKEYLSCLIEGRQFVPPDRSQQAAPPAQPNPGQNTLSQAPVVDKARTEAYFDRIRSQNETRPENVPPSQGGKYAGFGNTPAGQSRQGGASGASPGELSVNSLQQDPLGALTKGWSLFSSTVAKSVNEVHESVIKPGFTQLQGSELGSETKRAMAQFGQKMQQTGKYGQETFSTFTRDVQDKGFNESVGSFFGNIGGRTQAGSNVDRAFGFKKPDNEAKMPALGSDSLGGHKDEDEWDAF
ncbi:ArfGap-domain-containing protein [Metschnikowia bicuspidata var. bicuspidata NRRL YB-4993]|uniref:ArfGap-domain-containing protein n=1 Tax=Metschnikowia bicuspidata var. bicuspidata NRRL YB-4993 TaxID=869754 RepID=A0A1A0H8Z5_9ASCO|nr:ArfGap-domain-containing protein [Metschnikowia bicuspidata var. bicuspidata NRRL YB-4993]OBA20353.1 ArfGap-domain-containing protein [Metschnikowia bicuspidata var. bicuspidata NRRL YB-4993]